MGSLIKFFRESYIELVHKVTWPKFSELQKNSTLVLIASIIFALLIGVIDVVFDNGLDFLFYRTKQW